MTTCDDIARARDLLDQAHEQLTNHVEEWQHLPVEYVDTAAQLGTGYATLAFAELAHSIEQQQSPSVVEVALLRAAVDAVYARLREARLAAPALDVAHEIVRDLRGLGWRPR